MTPRENEEWQHEFKTLLLWSLRAIAAALVLMIYAISLGDGT